jgi:hypothetical protein
MCVLNFERSKNVKERLLSQGWRLNERYIKLLTFEIYVYLGIITGNFLRSLQNVNVESWNSRMVLKWSEYGPLMCVS